MIEFLCPEGHKIRCPEEQAGRPAKCPRCGVRFRIPTLAELGLEVETPEPALAEAASSPQVEVQPSVVADSKLGKTGSGKQIAPAPLPVEPPAPKEEQIEFLCPNGHHLHGPASLQGRAGECPECGSRFRIPLIDQPDEPSPVDAGLGGSGSGLGPLDMETIEASAPGQPLDLLQVLDEARGSSPSHADGNSYSAAAPAALAAPSAHPLGQLFAELWAAKGETSRVEVHLESGSVLLPDGYVKNRSQFGHAVLVGNESDGSSTLTIIPWDTVARIIVRGMKHVPGEILR